ncbi:alpha-1,3-mannosyltransferase MNT3 [Aspergillus udagawae]|nr:alpha-1,3-mannosyltransferase MNT3 [Aspergillus udagawae]GFG19277.1 alpha-1,3-mannosyltransferase MNT3 [Aspergillus udagawae]
MQFLHGLIGPRSIRLVALVCGTVLLCTIYLFANPSVSDDFWLFYRPLADENPDINLVKSLFRYTTKHPIHPPYQQAYGNVGRRSGLLRQWLNLARKSDDSATKDLLNDMAEKLAASTFLFLKERLNQHPSSQLQRPLADLQASFEPDSTGIVIPTSDKSVRSAARLLLNLRSVLGSTLPVQIAYAGDHDLAAENRELLSRIDFPGPPIEFLDINTVFNPYVTQFEHGGWEIKPFAALASRFERVLIADPDVGFFQLPDTFLQDEAITHAGAWMSKDRLFWYHAYRDPTDWDRYIGPDVDRYTLPGKVVDQALFIVDAGLAFFDKGRLDILLGLLCVCWQHSYDVRKELTHPLRYGSRAVWWRGLEMAGARYVEPDHYGGVIGEGAHDREGVKVCGSALVHVDPKGRLLWWKGDLSSDQGKGPHKWMIEGTSPGPFSARWEEIRGTYDDIKEAISRGVYCMIADEAGSLSDEELDIVGRLVELVEGTDETNSV